MLVNVYFPFFQLQWKWASGPPNKTNSDGVYGRDDRALCIYGVYLANYYPPGRSGAASVKFMVNGEPFLFLNSGGGVGFNYIDTVFCSDSSAF